MVVKARKLYPDAKIPERASPGAVGYDVYAYHVVDKNTRETCGELPIEIPPGGSVLVGIGVQFAVPFPIDCQVRPRSGLASKHDIELSNSPGTIDPDYRGEAGILLRNRGDKSFRVEKHARIAQLVFTRVEVPHLAEIETLPPTSRDTGGFGSTGFFNIALGDSEYKLEQAKWDEHFMGIAISAAGLSNCLRGVHRDRDGKYERDLSGRYCGAKRRFGCVIVKARNIVGQGFNTRTEDCSEEVGCIRERENIPSGVQNDKGCLHAEQVAVQNYASTGGASLDGATVYVNAEPCIMCAKLLIGCGIGAVVVPSGIYPENGLKIISSRGIEIRHVKIRTG